MVQVTPTSKGTGFALTPLVPFLTPEDPWFMGCALAAGPDGAVYLADWSEAGECHSFPVPKRISGRIYRLAATPARPLPARPVLTGADDAALVGAQQHANEWHVRRARRLIQERAAAGTLAAATVPALADQLAQAAATPARLRALWALHAAGGLDAARAEALLRHDDARVRSWTLRLLAGEARLALLPAARLAALAQSDPSPHVRLALTIAARRLPPAERWPLLTPLAARGEDAGDPNLPSMLWYALEPAVAADRARGTALADACAIPKVGELIRRRIADQSAPR